MAGIIDGLLGAALGASGAVVGNAQFARQQQAEQDKEARAMDRETFLMELRSKYNKGEADYSDKLARGRAVHQQQLQLDGLNAKQVIEAEKRKRTDALNDHRDKIDADHKNWVKQNEITHKQALELQREKQAGDRSLVNARIAAKGKGGADDDDDVGGLIGHPDFVKGQKDLLGYFGIDIGDQSAIRQAKTKLGLPESAGEKDVSQVIEAATNVLSANKHISPDEAAAMGRALAFKKLKLQLMPLPDGRQLQYFTVNGRRYAYGRPN